MVHTLCESARRGGRSRRASEPSEPASMRPKNERYGHAEIPPPPRISGMAALAEALRRPVQRRQTSCLRAFSMRDGEKGRCPDSRKKGAGLLPAFCTKDRRRAAHRRPFASQPSRFQDIRQGPFFRISSRQTFLPVLRRLLNIAARQSKARRILSAAPKSIPGIAICAAALPELSHGMHSSVFYHRFLQIPTEMKGFPRGLTRDLSPCPPCLPLRRVGKPPAACVEGGIPGKSAAGRIAPSCLVFRSRENAGFICS